MLGVALTAAGAGCALPVAIKAVGEIHRGLFLESNVLARQGLGAPENPGEGDKLARQRTGGIKGGLPQDEPGYVKKTPTRAQAGDLRQKYRVKSLGNATSSRGNLDDVLNKVPQRTYGTDAYKRIYRPVPTRAPGFDNQAFP